VQVFVVVRAVDAGMIWGVFSTVEKAAEYIANHPYDGFILEELTLDKGKA
jgi:hypothetical protein